MLQTGNVPVEEFQKARHLASALHFRLAQLHGIRRIKPRDADGVDVGQLVVAAGAGPEVVTRMVKYALTEDQLVPRFKRAGQMDVVHMIGAEGLRDDWVFVEILSEGLHIDVYQPEQQAHGLHEAVGRAALLKGGAAERGNVAVAGAVDDAAREIAADARLVCDQHALDPVPLRDGSGDKRVVQNRAFCLQQHLFGADLHPFRVQHGDGMNVSLRGLDVTETGILLHQTADQLLRAAADDLLIAARIEVDERQARGRAAADVGVGFQKQRPCAGSGGGQRRSNPGRAAAADNDVIVIFLHD